MAEDPRIEVLWTSEQIFERVVQLAGEILQDLGAAPSPPVAFIGVATGAFIFLADLVRHITCPVAVDFVRADSYGSSTQSNGAPRVSLDLKNDISGLHVVLVEDIVETGNTLSCIIELLKSKGASSVSVCALIDKPHKREVQFELVGKGKYYRGFECPDLFVIGYGMDLLQQHRNLPYIGVLKTVHP